MADRPIAGAVERLNEMIEAGVRVVFCTNNSQPTIERYVAKLRGMGARVTEADVVTSASVTGEFLGRASWGTTAVVIGGDGVHEAVAGAGIEIVPPPGDRADLVVVGWDLELTYDKLKRATLAITRGARLVATNDDAAYPAPDGLWPGTGAIVAAIERATGATAMVMGKPHAPMMDAAAARMEGRSNIAMVGDRPETDLAGGRARGWATVLVLSGVTAAEDADRVSPRPDLVIPSLAELELDLL